MKYFDKIEKFINIISRHIIKNKECKESNDDEKKSIKLREEVNKLYFNDHISKSDISRKKKVSRNFVIRWTKSPDQDFTEDNRGWPKSKRRKWDKAVEQRIKEIHQYLKNDPYEFYTGATAIAQEWRKRHPKEEIPPLRTIGQILKDLDLSDNRKRRRNKGAARYLCYPEYTIYHLLGGRVLEADFIGKKYIAGRSEPINFIGFSFKKIPKLRYFMRVSGQTAENFIRETEAFFERFEKPDFVKVDNCLATIGSGSGKRNISRTMKFLLENQVIPIFSVPRKPFSQASIEGNNSVFSRMFWNKIEFENVQEIDEKLSWFNLASQRYTAYQPPSRKSQSKEDFIPKIYFIRQVKDDENQTEKAFINVLNEKVYLPTSYVNYFVLAEWNLLEEQLFIHFEKDQNTKIIEKVTFEINPRSKKKIQKLLEN
ncbi:MAG: hypothetical protein ACE5K4_12915 [Candidatus Hydrothermarchaeota archaeon]